MPNEIRNDDTVFVYQQVLADKLEFPKYPLDIPNQFVHLARTKTAAHVRLALAIGADPNAKGVNGTTAVDAAAYAGKEETIRILAQAGARITQETITSAQDGSRWKLIPTLRSLMQEAGQAEFEPAPQDAEGRVAVSREDLVTAFGPHMVDRIIRNDLPGPTAMFEVGAPKPPVQPAQLVLTTYPRARITLNVQ